LATSSNRTGLLITSGLVLLLAVAGVFVVIHFRETNPPEKKQSAQPLPPPAVATVKNPADRMWDVMAGMANLDQHGSNIPPDKTPAEYAKTLGADPDKLLAGIQNQVALVPYEGSMAEPAQIFASGMANSLDRARLLAALLTASGTQARVVSVRQDGKSAAATYATSPRAALPRVRPEVLAAVQKEVADHSAAIFTKLSGGTNLATNVASAKAEQRLYWVQYQNSGKWVDLIASDMNVAAAQRQAAQVLSADAESKLAWQIKLTVINLPTGNSPAKGKEVLSYSARASGLNAIPVTFLNRPDGSLKKFIPTLLVGDKKIEGTGFASKDGPKELRNQLLKIDVTGPAEARHFVRVLVGEPGASSEAERGLEIATSAQITVQTGIVSDAQFERAITGSFSQSARLLFHSPAPGQNPEPDNSASIPAIAILDASHRFAGQVGEFSKHVLAFQARPAIALDRDFVQVKADSLARTHSFDLIDPGHSLYGANVAAETLLRAAAEQSEIDALLEDWMATGESVITSRRIINNLLASGAEFGLSKPSPTLSTDDFGKIHPVYRTVSDAQNGIFAGWRVDPGPQVVPIIGDLSGGTRSVNGQMARLKTLCTGLTWGAILVPAEIFPPTFMLGGIVNYDCQLAKAYVKSAAVIDGLASQIGGAPPSTGTSPDDVAKQIKEMTDGLINDIIKNAIASAVKGMAVRGITDVTSEAAESIISKLVDAAAEYINGKLSESGEKDALSNADTAAIKDAVQSAMKLEQSGASPEQVEKAIQNHGH
jgi:hypothetical protein